MKPPKFQYHRPSSIEAALGLLAEHGDGAKVLAGGQSLLPLLNLRLAFPERLIDINELPELADVERRDGSVRVGALVRQQAFLRSADVRKHVPLAAEAAAHVGHHVTRNRGTVAGSLAHADSRGELPVALTALGGSVMAASRRGTREIPASELFVTDFTSSLEADEIIVESRWPILGNGWSHSFQELALRHGDYAIGMVAATIHVSEQVVDDVRIVVGSVADRPVILDRISQTLEGAGVAEPPPAGIAETVADSVEPAGDVHASADYRRHIAGVLAERALGEAWQRANDA